MLFSVPESLVIIAGRGAYPVLLAESARAQGVKRICAVAFKGETRETLTALVDEIQWVHLGQLSPVLEALKTFAIPRAVMAGQIKPTHLFRVRMDSRMLTLLARLKERNAETIFAAVGEAFREVGVELEPASRFMEKTMPGAGVLGTRPPSAEEQQDIELGIRVAKTTSALDIGQTVVIKHGTILAVEAFEGTDATIERAGELGGAGAVVVKVAKCNHDMRFDIPVIGDHTMKVLKKAKIAVLAVEAGRTILLEREKLIEEARKQNLCFIAVPSTTHA